MSTFDNAEPLADWQLPPRCCGDWCTDTHCPTCGYQPQPPAATMPCWACGLTVPLNSPHHCEFTD